MDAIIQLHRAYRCNYLLWEKAGAGESPRKIGNNSNLAEYLDDYQTPHGEKEKEWHQAIRHCLILLDNYVNIERKKYNKSTQWRYMNDGVQWVTLKYIKFDKFFIDLGY